MEQWFGGKAGLPQLFSEGCDDGKCDQGQNSQRQRWGSNDLRIRRQTALMRLFSYDDLPTYFYCTNT